MDERVNILLQLYSEERLQARQSEDQRATLTNIIIVALAAGLAIVADQQFDMAWLAVAISLILLGSFGAIATRKYFERWLRHWNRAYAYREQLFSLFPSIPTELALFTGRSVYGRNDRYESELDARFKFMKAVKLHILWVSFHIIVALVGIGLLLVLVFLGPP
jgi:hypothetical protein